jgi:amidohydrolase
VIGLRADMDALPINETTNLPYASTQADKMHRDRHIPACRRGRGGGLAMCEDGLMERWNIQQVFAMHNEPGLPIGSFSTATGPLGAAADGFRIKIEGKGTHGADSHLGVDTLLATANILMAFQSIVSRNLDPRKAGVVTVGSFHGGSAGNIIPQTAEMVGTVRLFDPGVRDMLQKRVTDLAEGIAASYGATATVSYRRMFPPVINHVKETELAVQVARSFAGHGKVIADRPPIMGSEDFAFMLERRPGNIMLIGKGDTAGLHESGYDFNDQALPFGIRYWVGLIETLMPLNHGPDANHAPGRPAP